MRFLPPPPEPTPRRTFIRGQSRGRRHGLHLEHVKPAAISDVLEGGELIVAVCDNAHEELQNDLPRLHWSVPDPVRRNTDGAFEDAYHELQQRVQNLATLQATAPTAAAYVRAVCSPLRQQ